MLVRSYSKTNNLVAEEVISVLKQQYPQRQWVASSKLSPDEIQGLNSQFGVGEQLPSLPSGEEKTDDERSPDSDTQENSVNKAPGQIQTAPQQLPQAQQSSSEMAEAIQYLLSQQQPQSYASSVGIEAARLDGAAQAFRKFTAFHSSEAATSEGLQQLNQTLNDLQIKASVDGFGASQRDFLSNLRHISEKSQDAQSQNQQRVQTAKNQSTDSIRSMQDAVLNAIANLKTTGSLDS